MESGRRKKKRNNKKKNEQATTLTESVTNDGWDSTSYTRSHVVETEQNLEVPFSGPTDASNDVGRKMDSDTDGHFSNGIEETNLAKAEKQYWIDREASFEEKIKQLQAEKDIQMQKEAILENELKELLKEKDENLQKWASFEEKIEQLQAEKDAQMQKEAILEDKIKNLLREKDENLQNLAGQEETIRQLNGEKIACIQKEEMLEERYKQLQREKDAYLQKEISTEESIAALSNDSKKLQARVMELEESRKSLLKEKQELIEKVSSLQLHIDNLESRITYSHPYMNNIGTSEDGNADHQPEVMHPPSEKLVPENPGLVEKVNGMYADSLPVGSNPADIAALSAVDNSTALTQHFALGAEGTKMMPVSHSARSLAGVTINFERNCEDVNGEDGSGMSKSSEEMVEADEIVQIPLGDSQTEDASLEVYEKNDASFIDAPLIGAPFRFISFVARYVSGADLVNKNAENSV
ncbi:uncharacterized protein LOC142525405 isoform X2 [Primulina tabacum]|uniref:uncharacterized protein LOC142525405 isoform X2 n=1 Tax=Primulina tabacum TaxID=48773 RepID=UPI003F59CBD9